MKERERKLLNYKHIKYITNKCKKNYENDIFYNIVKTMQISNKVNYSSYVIETMWRINYVNLHNKSLHLFIANINSPLGIEKTC